MNKLQIPFSKMQGLGNDFVVIDQVTNPQYLNNKQIKLLSDRHYGVGCDQLIYVEAPVRPDADFHYRVFNADGSEIGHCGNGARCFYRFVKERKLTWKGQIRVSTETGGVLEISQSSHGMVSVEMDEPQFKTSSIPITCEQEKLMYRLVIADESLDIGLVSMGNPHCVILVPDVESAPVNELGPMICQHPWFPEGVNVGFMEVINPVRVKLRVFERGLGETQACGTGACAALAVGRQQGWLDERIRVELAGGHLQLAWKGVGNKLKMTGSATTVFEGIIEI